MEVALGVPTCNAKDHVNLRKWDSGLNGPWQSKMDAFLKKKREKTFVGRLNANLVDDKKVCIPG
jgi:hypothetical protein